MHFVTKGLVIVLLAVFLTFDDVNCQVNPNNFAECLKSEDCGPGECCVIGMIRYSIPRCMALGHENEWCREQIPENRTLAYPNGVVLETGPLYTLFCPCSQDYTCDRAKCVKKGTHSNVLNNRR